MASKTTISLILVACCFYSVISYDFIVSGSFELVSTGPNETMSDNNELYPWKSDSPITIGKGHYFNPEWPQGLKVVQLNYGANTKMCQLIRLRESDYATYYLTYEYAAREGHVEESTAIVTWNGEIISEINPENASLAKHMIEIKQARDGGNYLCFEGTGKTPNKGVGISRITLDYNKPTPKPDHPQVAFMESFKKINLAAIKAKITKKIKKLENPKDKKDKKDNKDNKDNKGQKPAEPPKPKDSKGPSRGAAILVETKK